MQNALALHGVTLQEIIVNDEIRKFFRKLTMEEIDLTTKLSKYGKLKDWVNVTPTYKGGA